MGKLYSVDFHKRKLETVQDYEGAEEQPGLGEAWGELRASLRGLRLSAADIGRSMVAMWQTLGEEEISQPRPFVLGRILTRGIRQAVFEIRHPDIPEEEMGLRRDRAMGALCLTSGIELEGHELERYEAALAAFPDGPYVTEPIE